MISPCVYALRKNDVSKNYLFGKTLSVECHLKQTVGSMWCVVSVQCETFSDVHVQMSERKYLSMISCSDVGM